MEFGLRKEMSLYRERGLWDKFSCVWCRGWWNWSERRC